jgi:surface antigen
MKRSSPTAAIAAILALVMSPSVSSQALGFMDYSPVAYYTDEDNRLADEAGLDALDDYADNVVREWRNPQTGASGSITPLETYENEAGHICRKARAVDRTTSPPLRGEFVFTLCKDPEKGWQFVKRK